MNSHLPILPEHVACAIRAAVGAGPATLHEPSFKGNEWHYLKDYLVGIGITVRHTLADSTHYTGHATS